MNKKTLHWLLIVLLVVVILVIGLWFFAGKSFSRQTGQPANFREQGAWTLLSVKNNHRPVWREEILLP
jgi:hypothetical protein